MSFSSTYSHIEKRILDVKTLIESIRFIIINAILGFIFFFLALEEVDWAIFSSRERIKDTVIDNTSWNINKMFWFY